jgi:serine/threonine protein kinase
VYVTDLGMCRPVNETEDTKKIYGVLPYVAPEILRGGKYTPAADIYSLGMIMWEMSSNQPPFSDRAHDYSLARDICEGLRPSIIEGTPRGYVAAMLRCWDADSKKRPTTDDLLAVSYKWRFLSDGKAPFTGPRSNKRVKTLTLLKSNLPSGNTQHPQAFYTSRLLHYPNLPEPKNSDTFTLFNPQTGEIHTMVRKQASKNQPSVRQSSDNSIKENLQSFSAINENEKGKERAQEHRQHRMRDAQRSNLYSYLCLKFSSLKISNV